MCRQRVIYVCQQDKTRRALVSGLLHLNLANRHFEYAGHNLCLRGIVSGSNDKQQDTLPALTVLFVSVEQ